MAENERIQSAAPRPEISYRIAGEGREIFTRSQIRDRIRTGELTSDNELAPVDTEDYRPAGSFPELARYFSLLTAPVMPDAPHTAAASDEPVAGRIVAGVVYPFTGIGGIILVAAAVLQSVPFGSLVAGAFTIVYTLAIIRSSSEGSITMPPLSALRGPADFFFSLLKAIGVTIGSAWPIILAIPLTFIIRSAMLPFIAAFVVVIYLPAAMAALARWNSLVLALTPSSMFRMMSVLGTDYLFAIVVMLVAMGVALFAAGAAATVIPSPLAVEALGTLFMLWAVFYAYHLIGWGIYRHRDEM